VGEITVSVVGSKNPNWFDTHGVMNVTRAVLPVMRRQRSGHLFTIASMGGYLGGSRGTAYAASKFAVAGFTESLALELEEFGITDNCRTRILPHRFSRQVLGDSRTGDAHRGLSRVKCAFRAATETANHAQ